MPDDSNRGYAAVEDEIRELRDELARLREEHRRILDDHPANEGQKAARPPEKEEQKGQDKEGKEQGKEDKKQDKDEAEDKPQPPKPPLYRRIGTWARTHPVGLVAILIALVAAGIGAYFLWNYLQSYEATDDAEIEGHIAQIGSRIAGTVVGVYVENARSVVQGQTLADLDPRDYETALAQARAAFAQAQAALEEQAPNVPITQTTQATNVSTAALQVANASATAQQARQSYESAKADLAQAEANETNAAAEEARYRELVAKDEVSREQYDQKLTALHAQQALVASRRASAEAAQKTIDQREAELATARERYREAQTNQPREIAVQHASVATRRANVTAAAAQVEQAKLNLSYCKILAPEAGIIGNKTVEVGQQVAPGQELLAITPTDDLWVTANFKETQIKSMHPGQRVTIHVDAIDQDFNGYVQNLPGATGAMYSLLPPENATGNYVKVVQRLPVRIRFKPNQKGFERLRPGMSVEPKVWVNQ